MSTKRKSAESEKNHELGFEDALSKIESIVESMEDGQLPLEDLVSQYEAGSALLKHCETLLSSARERIELITLANREETENESSSPSLNSPKNISGDTDENNDISLF